MNFDEEKFNQLLATGDFEGARGLIDVFFGQKFTDKDKGSILADSALSYVKLLNKLNERYISFLEEMIAEIKNLDDFKKEASEKFDTAILTSKVKSEAI